MALSLDYIGKFVIMTVAIAVAITLIVSFRGEILGTTPTVPDNNGENGQPDVVQIDTSSDYKSEVQDYIQLCNQRRQQRAESFTCFILVAENGRFQGTLGEYYPPDISNPFGGNTPVDSQTLIIRYQLTDNTIRIDQE